MSQPSQWSAGPPRSGSVKKARERAMSASDRQAPSSRPNEVPARTRPPMPAVLADTRAAQGPIGVAISRPTQAPQWPLSGSAEPPSQSAPAKGAAPQRPPRPSHVPSILDASKIQDHTPSFPYRPPQDTPSQPSPNQHLSPHGDVTSPGVPSPITPSSRPSTISSVGTIPDFPVPSIPAPPPAAPTRRSANLGPPPSSRRGNTSYYSQSSFVSPIPEESPRATSHVSYASSAAIPTSWGSASPASPGYDDDEFLDIPRSRDGPNEEGRESRGSNQDDNEEKALVRSASLGKRAKPAMIVTKGASRPGPTPSQESSKRTSVDKGAGTAKSGGVVWPMLGNPDSPLAGGTGLIDKSTSSSENEVPTMTKFESKSSSSNETSSKSERASQILGAYQAASSLQPRGVEPSRTPSPFRHLSAIRRPPRLDIDAVRDAEARGSLTSLPDLIRRATRLAAMMDRGKRPASRLNELNDFALYSDLAAEKEMGGGYEKHQSGLSGMLAAFPPPGLATPTRHQSRSISPWPRIGGNNDEPQDDGSTPRKRRRCCCGLPAWAVCILLLLMLAIVAAAVVVPIELLVVHKKHSATPASALAQCQKNLTCANGGTNVVNSGTCSCLCTNGFTGNTCTTSGAAGCTTTDISDSITNVTVGAAIPRLLLQAQQNFSIPLSPTIILAQFNDASLSCGSQNALVTFDGLSERDIHEREIVPHPSTTLLPRQRPVERDSPAAATTNGIIFDPSSPTAASYGSSPTTVTRTSTTVVYGDPTPTPTSNPTSTSSSSSASSSGFVITSEALDFARVAVLFILQQENVNAAVSAQGSFEGFFSQKTISNSSATSITVGNGNVVNLSAFSLKIANGTTFGKNA